MIYVTYFFAAAFILFAGIMFFAVYRTRHFGLLLMAITYACSGLLAIGVGHWWPLLTGLVLAWLLRLVGLEPKVEVQESRDEDGGMRDEGKKPE